MASHLDELMEKLRQVQAEIEVEPAKRREELRFHLETRRIVFEREVLRIHRELKTRVTHSGCRHPRRRVTQYSRDA